MYHRTSPPDYEVATATAMGNSKQPPIQDGSWSEFCQPGGWQNDDFYEEHDQSPSTEFDVLDMFWDADPSPLLMPGRPAVRTNEDKMVKLKATRPQDQGLFQRGTSSGSGSDGDGDGTISEERVTSGSQGGIPASGSGSRSGSGGDSDDSPESSESSESSEDSVDSSEEEGRQDVSRLVPFDTFGCSNAAMKQAFELASAHARPPRATLPKDPAPTVPQSKEMQKELRALKRSEKQQLKMSHKRFLADRAREHTIGTYMLPTDMPALLLSAQAPHEIVDLNKEWCRWCCYSRDEAIGKSFRVTHGPGTQQERVARVMSAMATGVGCIAVLTYVDTLSWLLTYPPRPSFPPQRGASTWASD